MQLACFVGLLALLTKPVGLYLCQVLEADGRTWFDPILKPLERLTYKAMAVKPDQEQGWKQHSCDVVI